ncbi:MAG: leucine--tRNA ligase [Clostridiales bacterium]|nr:leucine--tRNA ligase [Clostridiales bacterium]
MNRREIEKKWQKYWEENNLHNFDPKNIDRKFYVLEMFSYPSGANLHIGHWWNFGLSDSYARFKKMQGYEVFQPMGFDSFGLPAENYAIKTGIHPKDSTYQNIATMERQIKEMGLMIDWSAEIITSDPSYYRWTQWLFLQLYKRGLAYQKDAPVNWCPSCNTVIANEQVQNGECERCHSVVERRNMTQWFFKITDYAEELLNDLNKLDWPEKTKIMQTNWIGKSVGGEIEFATESGHSFRVFTTRADTLPGLSFVVLAPEHPLVDIITAPEQKQAVQEYQKQTLMTSEIDRLSTAKEKTGVFTGAYAISPLDNKRVPIFIADYVLYTYGTGAVMGVPAHDERDFVFAQKYNLPITRVIKSADGSPDDLPYTEYGIMVNSGMFDGLTSEEGQRKVIEYLSKINKGEQKVNYRLRDWSVSRQRFWGCPIPIIHCQDCGAVPVPEDQLPVELPYDVNFTPDGQSPLKKHERYINVKCPVCKRDAKRDPDTLDTFVCSSWYFLRYPNAHNDKAAFDKEYTNKIMPVDKYIGGSEHAVGHLLYSRFIVKALRDMGYLDFDEPFLSLVHQGMILGPDGYRMSKSRGNTINPDDYIKDYGSDIFRLYLAFGFNYTDGGPWNDEGIRAMERFSERVDRIVQKYKDCQASSKAYGEAEKELDYVLHNAIKEVRADYETFSFNTAMARIMELVNAIYKYDSLPDADQGFAKSVITTLIKLLAPLAPHMCEEWYEMLGNKPSIFSQSFPEYDESKLFKDQIEIAVQINGKLRGTVVTPSNASQEQVKQIVFESPQIAKYLEGKTPKKVIVIPGRIVNIVI